MSHVYSRFVALCHVPSSSAHVTQREKGRHPAGERVRFFLQQFHSIQRLCQAVLSELLAKLLSGLFHRCR